MTRRAGSRLLERLGVSYALEPLQWAPRPARVCSRTPRATYTENPNMSGEYTALRKACREPNDRHALVCAMLAGWQANELHALAADFTYQGLNHVTPWALRVAAHVAAAGGPLGQSFLERHRASNTAG